MNLRINMSDRRLSGREEVDIDSCFMCGEEIYGMPREGNRKGDERMVLSDLEGGLRGFNSYEVMKYVGGKNVSETR